MTMFALAIIFVPTMILIAWFGIRKTDRFQRWTARRLKKEAAGLDPAVDQGFAKTLAQDARDKGAV